jgi:hypothetical protein
MELMTHQDQQVRYQALTATQKYFAMVSWCYPSPVMVNSLLDLCHL